MDIRLENSISLEKSSSHKDNNLTWDEILQEITKEKCKYPINCYNDRNKQYIIKINEMIKNALQIDPIPKKVFEAYINLMLYCSNQYYLKYTRFYNHHSIIEPLLYKLALYHTPDLEYLFWLLSYYRPIGINLLNIIVERGEVLSNEVINHLLADMTGDTKNSIITITYIVSSQPEEDQIKSLKKLRISTVYELMWANSKIKIDQEIFNKLLEVYSINDVVIKKYLPLFQIEDEAIASSSVNYDHLKHILDMKILPNNLEKIAKKKNTNINKILDLLIVYGYVITKQDACHLIHYLNCVTQNYFNFELDKECLKSLLSGYYPLVKNYSFNCQPDTECFEILLDNKNTTNLDFYVKDFLASYDVEITDNILNKALDSSTLLNITKNELLKKNDNIFISVYSSYITSMHDPFIKTIFENLLEKYEKCREQCDEYKKRFDIVHQEDLSKNDDFVKKEEISKELLPDNKLASDDELVIDYIATDENYKDFNEIYKDFNEDLIIVQKLKKITIDDDIGSNYDANTLEIFEEDRVNRLLHIDIEKLNIPKNKRKKDKIPVKMSKMFGMDKSIKMSFIEIRKFFKTMLLKQDLLVQQDKRLFTLQSRDRKILGLPITGDFRVSDLDKIIGLLWE